MRIGIFLGDPKTQGHAIAVWRIGAKDRWPVESMRSYPATVPIPS